MSQRFVQRKTKTKKEKEKKLYPKAPYLDLRAHPGDRMYGCYRFVSSLLLIFFCRPREEPNRVGLARRVHTSIFCVKGIKDWPWHSANSFYRVVL